MATNSFTVKFTMTPAEYSAALRSALLHQRILWLMIAVFAYFVSSPFVTFFLKHPGAPAAEFPKGALVYPAIGVLALAWLFGVVPILMVRRMNPAMRDREQVFRFTDDGAEVVSPAGEAKFPWSTWVRFKETGRFFMLYPTKQVVHVLPKRAFGSEQEIVDFRNLLRMKIRRP